ncbi:MAG: GAF domain-containing protein [Candidatus Gastranaerophilaceae bacterium]
MNDKQTKILNFISEILNKYLTADEMFEAILNGFNEIFSADLGLVAYISGNGLEIKQFKTFDNRKYKTNDVNETGLMSRAFIKNKQPLNVSVNKKANSILTEIGIYPDDEYSFMALPLIIKSALFGIIIVLKNKKGFYSQEDLTGANALASVCSYSIKDFELAEVFQLQLKALKENIIEKTNAYEIIKTQSEKIKKADRL